MQRLVVSNRYVKNVRRCIVLPKKGLVSVVIEVVIRKCSHNVRNKIANSFP